ncbi:MAG: amino acid permease, partial [candidate division KSB1 bacterium]|nr:amino acid permease [candidate division KSB1 bacterium]
ITLIYIYIKSGYKIEDDLSTMVKGVLFQLTRTLQVLIQQKQSEAPFSNWRPSFIAISSNTESRLAPFDFLRWISHYYGFGTFIHFVKGMLDEKTNEEAEERFNQLLRLSRESKSGIYVDTIISPSFKTAVAQIIQIPGISGLENNSILFEFPKDEAGEISDIIDGCHFASLVDFNICVLRSSDRHFGYNRMIHIWLTPGDYRNANMMILLTYILLGHPTWKGCEIEIYAAFEKKELDKQYKRLNDLIDKGRIPIASKNVTKIPWDKRARSYENLVTEHSSKADLVIMGFSIKKLTQDKGEFFKKFSDINDLLFVRAGQKIIISDDE